MEPRSIPPTISPSIPDNAPAARPIRSCRGGFLRFPPNPAEKRRRNACAPRQRRRKRSAGAAVSAVLTSGLTSTGLTAGLSATAPLTSALLVPAVLTVPGVFAVIHRDYLLCLIHTQHALSEKVLCISSEIRPLGKAGLHFFSNPTPERWTSPQISARIIPACRRLILRGVPLFSDRGSGHPASLLLYRPAGRSFPERPWSPVSGAGRALLCICNNLFQSGKEATAMLYDPYIDLVPVKRPAAVKKPASVFLAEKPLRRNARPTRDAAARMARQVEEDLQSLTPLDSAPADLSVEVAPTVAAPAPIVESAAEALVEDAVSESPATEESETPAEETAPEVPVVEEAEPPVEETVSETPVVEETEAPAEETAPEAPVVEEIEPSAEETVSETPVVEEAEAPAMEIASEAPAEEAETPAEETPAPVEEPEPDPLVYEGDFDRRLAQRRDELKWLFCELYDNNMEAYLSFEDMLRQAWARRKGALRAQDAAREADPNWYRHRDILGMILYVNAFAGTLRGVESKLPYLEECGVNLLHLMPFLQSPKGRSDGGYAVADFRTVQPELGTMEDLESLADACRKAGLRLCMDFVLNHTSEDHE